MAWTKVDPDAWKKAVAILCAADHTDPAASRKALDEANALVGIKSKTKARPGRILEGE